MALRLANQTAFLGVGVWHRTDDTNASGRRFSPGREHGEPNASVRRKHRNSPSLSARTQSFRSVAYRSASNFRLSFLPDAFGSGPNIDHPHIPQSGGGGGFRTSRMKGLPPLFLGIFGTFPFSVVELTVIPNWQIGHLNPQMEEDGTDVYPQPQPRMPDRRPPLYPPTARLYSP